LLYHLTSTGARELASQQREAPSKPPKELASQQRSAEQTVNNPRIRLGRAGFRCSPVRPTVSLSELFGAIPSTLFGILIQPADGAGQQSRFIGV
jgi:hypothetical protein